MNIRPPALCLASLALICLSAHAATADDSSPSRTYSITPHDADAKLVFTLTDQADHKWTDLFTSSRTRAAVSQWQAVTDTRVTQDDTERQAHLLTLLYWQSCLPNSSANVPDAAKAPHSEVDAQEANKLRYAPAGLPTEVLSNAFNKDSHWYQAALQQILTEVNEKQGPSQKDIDALKAEVKATGQGRDALTKWASSLKVEAKSIAKSDPARAKLLRSQAAKVEAVAGQVMLIKDQDGYKLQISSELRKRLPGSAFNGLFGGRGDKIVKLPMDKVLVVVQLLSAFTQNLAVSADRAEQVASLVNYAHNNQIKVNPDFDAQARSLGRMAGDTDQILIATFLNTTVDWIKQTAIATSPKALAILSKQLASSLEKVAPQYSIYLSKSSSQVVGRVALLFAASAGADLLFNTSGIYEGIKTAEFSERCAEDFEQIRYAAQRQLSGSHPAAGSLTTWATADYYHEVSVATYHRDYASLLGGARGATFLGNLITGGGIDESISAHTRQAQVIGEGAEAWIHPASLSALVALFVSQGGVNEAEVPAKNKLDTPDHNNSFQGNPDPNIAANFYSLGATGVVSVYETSLKALLVDSDGKAMTWTAQDGAKSIASHLENGDAISGDGKHVLVPVTEHTNGPGPGEGRFYGHYTVWGEDFGQHSLAPQATISYQMGMMWEFCLTHNGQKVLVFDEDTMSTVYTYDTKAKRFQPLRLAEGVVAYSDRARLLLSHRIVGLSPDGTAIVTAQGDRYRITDHLTKLPSRVSSVLMGYLNDRKALILVSNEASRIAAIVIDGPPHTNESEEEYDRKHITRLVRWDQRNGLKTIAIIGDGSAWGALYMSEDGNTIAGGYNHGSGNEPFLWTASRGFEPLTAVFEQVGLADATRNWQLKQVKWISADGATIAGDGINPQGANESWIVQLPKNWQTKTR